MKRKRTLYIVIAVALLAIVTFVVVAVRGKRHTFEQDFQVEAAARPGMVTRIYLADKQDNTVLLSYDKENGWLVDGQYEASKDKVDMLLETLSEMRLRSRVNKAAAENVIKLMAAKSVKVEVYYNDFRIKWFKERIRLFPYEKKNVIYVGHDTQDQLATYMYREGDDIPCVVYIPGFRGCLSPRFVVDPYLWRTHKVVDLSVQQIARVELEIPSMPEESFAVVREGDGFVMELLHPQRRVDGFDTSRVAQLLSSFVHLNFDEYARAVPKTELDTTFSRDPRTVLRITDTQGVCRELKTYIKYSNPDDILAMPDTAMYEVFDINRLYAVLDNKDTVLIQYYIFDNILQPASFFLGENKSYFAK